MARKKILNKILNPLGFTVSRSGETLTRDGFISNILNYRKFLIHEYFIDTEVIVKRGPFRELKLARDGAWSDGDLAAKLIGSYEKELHPYIKKIVDYRPSVLLNIGASEGYYSIGMKRLLPESEVFAYDIDEASRDVLKACAIANNVSVGMLSTFSFADMGDFAKYNSIAFIVDCEGCEIGIETIQQEILVRSTLLVELHDMMIPGITQRLLAHLSPTHDVTVIDEAPRNTRDFPEISESSSLERLILTCEFRGAPMRWLYAEPKG